MNLRVIGSGSNGNCYILEDGGHRLIIDAGVKWKEIQIACGFDIQSIDACLISHSHGDHSKSVKEIARAGIECVTGGNAVEPIYNATGAIIRPLLERRQNDIRGWRTTPIEVHHDVPCYGFIIQRGRERFAYFTDFSYVGAKGKEYTFKELSINHFLIAVNYSNEPSEDIEYRGHIYEGHSSLANVMDFLEGSVTDQCKSIIACHLSPNHADEEKIQMELSKLGNMQVGIATKGKVFEL